MEKRYNLLSLDPMYSPLHEKIAKIVALKKYAVTSCLSKRIYLPTFEHYLATSLISSISKEDAKDYELKVASIKTYHHAFVSKVEQRKLSNEELNYMARFYVSIRHFIRDRKIDLVLMHTDSRWYHALVIDICKELNIRYLVTEQGLIRPYTTVIDPQGVNANSKIEFDCQKDYCSVVNSEHSQTLTKDKHDSIKSMCVFFVFLFCFTLERCSKNKTIVRYMHNNYSLRKYSKRIVNKFLKNKPLSRIHITSRYSEDSVLLLLQLEHDSQFLLHSPFNTNQEVIELAHIIARSKGLKLAIKRHPLDENQYNLPNDAYYVDGKVAQLASMADVVLTINSSASIDVLKTSTALVMLGDSIYNYKGVAEYLDIKAQDKFKYTFDVKINARARQRFIDYLNCEYLLQGAGYAYCSQNLQKKLEKILNQR